MNAPANIKAPVSQTSLNNHGFKRMVGLASSGFILYSDGPESGIGHRIYIPAVLAEWFASLVNLQGPQTAQRVMRGLSQLPSSALGFQAYSNAQNAFEHFVLVENLRITYIVLQDNNLKGLNPGVYITDMDVAEHASGHKPGLYRVKSKVERWELSKKPASTIATSHAAINGLAESIEHAAQKTMPGMIAAAYKDDTARLQSEGYTLAYNPPPLYQRGSEWRTPEQKAVSGDHTAAILAKGLYNAQLQQKEVHWTIHGDGATLLLNALKKLPPRFSLDKHTLFFAAPSPVMNELITEVENRQMSLAKNVMKFHKDDWRSVTVRAWQQYQVGQRLAAKGGDHALTAEMLKGQAWTDAKALNNLVKPVYQAGSGLGAIGLAIAAGMEPGVAIAVGLGGAEGLRRACTSLVFNAETYRNLLAMNTTNMTLNPHFSPTMSPTEFNARARVQHGGVVKSFVALVRELGSVWRRQS